MFCKRDQDVPVQLDVRDVVDVAVRGQHAVLVLAAEERDLDLLTLVLVGVVLHGLSLATASDLPRPRDVVVAVARVIHPCIGTAAGGRDRSQGAAVRHHQHAVVRMALRDVRSRFEHAPRHRLERLALRPAGPALAPPRVALRISLLDLVGRQTGPLADVDLAQARVELDAAAPSARRRSPRSRWPARGRSCRSRSIPRPRSASPSGPSLAPARRRSTARPRDPASAARRSSRSARDGRGRASSSAPLT